MRRSTTIAVLAITTMALSSAPALAGKGGKGGGGSLPKAIVSLGDSYISGEAGRWEGNSNDQWGNRDGTDRAAHSHWWGWDYHDDEIYLQGTHADNCHRADVAQIHSATIGGYTSINLACSGAVTSNIWRASQGGQSQNGWAPQADQLASVAASYDIEVINLSIGGNDLGFADIIASCAANWSSSSSSNPDWCWDDEQPGVDAKVPQMILDTKKAIDEITTVLSNAGQAPGTYRFVLQSYPSPIPRAAENRYPESGWSRLDTGGCPFWDADSDWARDSLAPQIDGVLEQIAADEGVEFLSLVDFLQGREVCSTATSLVGNGGPNPIDHEWTRFLVSGYGQGEMQESFHPNAYAQRALGLCLDQWWAQPVGDYRCDNVPGAGYDQVSLSPLA